MISICDHRELPPPQEAEEEQKEEEDHHASHLQSSVAFLDLFMAEEERGRRSE